MKLIIKVSVFVICIVFSFQLKAQLINQVIRGTIVNKFSKQAIQFVVVKVKEIDSIVIITNEFGEFYLQLPTGRYSLMFSKSGYQSNAVSDIILNSAKQVVLNIELEEQAKKLTGAIVNSKKAKDKTINDASLISTRQLTTEEANRYAGSLGDPARMAQNFAGVVTNGDRRNDIIIRGNSPLGVSWRAEGIEIPNPNHFNGVGTTGGAISILNNNNLSNSDFLTGAFAPQYGNALAGVFDLRLKNGNNQKREHTLQFGFNGLEFGTEGPLSKKNKSSYIINVRYSTLELFDALKINLGANASAQYRDLTFKFHVPTIKYGTFDVWNIGGFNLTKSFSKNYDTTGTKLNPRPKGFDTYFDNWMNVFGITHSFWFSKNTSSKLILAYSLSGNGTHVDSLFNNETQKFKWLDRYFADNRLNTSYQINHRFSSQNQTQIGIYYSRINLNISDSLWFGNPFNVYLPLLSYKGNTNLTRGFIQHLWKPSNKINVTAGIHAMHFSLNNTWAIEPRLALKYSINEKLSFTSGYGMHHQLQPFTTYFYNRTGIGSLKDSLTNLNLGLVKSQQVIIGGDYLPRANYRIKVEAYYQQITGAGVEQIPSGYSTLNEGAFYYVIPKPFTVANGKGFNRGIELTLEKFFSKQFYYLFTGTLYESKYQGSDKVWRGTAFNSNWTASGLFGYELKVRKNNSINFNFKLASIGGRLHSPIDTAASVIAGDTRFVDSVAFSKRYPAYFRPDLKISYRMNRKKTSQEIGVNIDNFINYKNIQSIEYDRFRNKVGYSYQNGLFPVIQYKLEF